MRAIFFLPVLLFANSLSITVNSPYVCLMNAETGKLLYSKRVHERIYPASVTKLATALYIAEECEIDEAFSVVCGPEALRICTEEDKVKSEFTLPPYILEDDGTTLHLKVKERLSIKSLLYGLLIRSANDAANVLATIYADSIPDFCFQLNKYLRTIGCKNTHFVNPHGLHHPDHYSTPYDLAIILKRAANHKIIRDIISTPVYIVPKTNLSSAREIKNGNKLIRPESKYYMKSVVGGKTGYHWRAKRNIAILADNNERSVIAVVNKSESREEIFNDCRKVLNSVFEEKPQKRMLFNAAESKFSNSYSWGNKELLASLKEDVVLTYYPSEEEELDVRVHWKEIDSPITVGDEVATLDVYNVEGVPIMQRSIFADTAVGHKFTHVLELTLNGLIKFVASYPKSFIFLFVALLFIFRRRKVKVV